MRSGAERAGPENAGYPFVSVYRRTGKWRRARRPWVCVAGFLLIDNFATTSIMLCRICISVVLFAGTRKYILHVCDLTRVVWTLAAVGQLGSKFSQYLETWLSLLVHQVAAQCSCIAVHDRLLVGTIIVPRWKLETWQLTSPKFSKTCSVVRCNNALLSVGLPLKNSSWLRPWVYDIRLDGVCAKASLRTRVA